MKAKQQFITKLVLLTSLAIQSYRVGAQHPSVYSLDECIAVALNNNELLQNSLLDMESSEFKVKEVKSALLPTIDLNSQYTYYTQLPPQYVPAKSFGGQEGEFNKLTMGLPQTTNINVQVRQVLFNQSLLTDLKAAKVYQEASHLKLKLTKDDIVYSVATTYYSIQVLEDNLSRVKENIMNLEKTASINESLKSNDLIAENIHNRLLINLENLKNQYENQRLVKQKNITLLKYLMNLSGDEVITVTRFDYESPIESPDFADINDRYDIKLQQVNIRIAEFDKKRAQAGYYPTLQMGFNYGFMGYDHEFAPGQAINGDWINSSALSLSLNIPLFDGLGKHYKIRQRDIAVQKNQNSLSLMRMSAARELQDAVDNYSSSANQFSNSKKSLDLAEHLFMSSQSEFESGITSTTDLLNAQNDLTNARTNYSTALLNLKLAELSWKKASGKLSQEFNN